MGWRRSPLGGNNGMQYYLWWTPASSPRARGLDLPENATGQTVGALSRRTVIAR